MNRILSVTGCTGSQKPCLPDLITVCARASSCGAYWMHLYTMQPRRRGTTSIKPSQHRDATFEPGILGLPHQSAGGMVGKEDPGTSGRVGRKGIVKLVYAGPISQSLLKTAAVLALARTSVVCEACTPKSWNKSRRMSLSSLHASDLMNLARSAPQCPQTEPTAGPCRRTAGSRF